MFSNEEALITGFPRKDARQLYDSVLHPQLWEMGRSEAEALAIASDRWQPRETYWLYQPSFRTVLW